MKEKIKELRIKIDGLAQLVEHLHPQRFFKIDIAQIPEGWTVEKFINYFKESGFAITDSRLHKVVVRAIQEVPQQFKEIENAKDSLYLAKAWLGKVLQELGEQTPYQNDGKRRDINDIESPADKAKTVAGLTEPFNPQNQSLNRHVDTWALNNRSMTDYDEKSHIEKVDWLREEIKNIIQETHIIRDYFEYRSQNDKVIWENIYTYLSEARFWLGFELERIKKQDESRKESSNN